MVGSQASSGRTTTHLPSKVFISLLVIQDDFVDLVSCLQTVASPAGTKVYFMGETESPGNKGDGDSEVYQGLEGGEGDD